MKCKNCGADLLATDKFCNQCGWKVEKKTRCPECGEALREGTRFCPKCGRMIGEDSSDGTVFVKEAETEDIPIADIEQNIVSMTEREMRISDKDKKTASAARRTHEEESGTRKSGEGAHKLARQTSGSGQTRSVRDAEDEGRRPKRSAPVPEPKKKSRPEPVKKRVYKEWEEDDWDEDEDEDEDDNDNIMMIISVCTAFLILAVAAFLIFTLVRKQPIRNYGESTEDVVEEENDAEDGGLQESDVSESGTEGTTEIQETESDQAAGTLSIVSNVNVRDNPSTEGSNVIKVAKAGETYEYIGTAEDGNWYIIVLEDGSTGYVFEKYVSVE